MICETHGGKFTKDIVLFFISAPGTEKMIASIMGVSVLFLDYINNLLFCSILIDGPGHNTPDPWSSSNGLPTSTYPSMLPGNSHHSQAYPSMHHSHDMVRSSPVGNSEVRHSPGVMVAQWLGNNPPSSSSSSVPSSRHHPQQVGIAIGIAMYSCHHFLSAQCVMSRYASDFVLKSPRGYFFFLLLCWWEYPCNFFFF